MIMDLEVKTQLWSALIAEARDAQRHGSPRDAEMYARAACTLARRIFGRGHEKLMLSQFLLADILFDGQRFEESAEMYREAVTALESIQGASHPAVGLGLRNLAEAYRFLGREKEATSINKRSRKIMSDWQTLNSMSAS